MIFRLLLTSLLCAAVKSSLSNGFYKFVSAKFGADFAEKLARKELGEKGSFGGGAATEPTRQKNVPIVFIHGQTRRAGDLKYILQNFLDNGYTFEELYGATYGTNVTDDNSLQDKLYCEYVLQTRRMLDAVSAYTKHEQIDVIAFSLGGAISRKAILGGKCVDTNETIGANMTDKIRNYISAAGVQQGVEACDLAKDLVPVCNANNGLYCGSDYISDLNADSGYEASKKAYAIESKSDEFLGNATSCNGDPALFSGATNITFQSLNHRAVVWFLGELIYNVSQGLPLTDLRKVEAKTFADEKRLSDKDIGIDDDDDVITTTPSSSQLIFPQQSVLLSLAVYSIVTVFWEK
ncbi:unnamed protein product [Bursaphelenchus xylophilus]|nr:unnamed protein product [Bursaphelenchus xylophilus]CAG9113094.1 unnamed protein product [Bursaphelenchus xylophilus]